MQQYATNKFSQKKFSDLEAFLKQKLISPEEIESRIDVMKKAGCTIATLNGSFDLLHAGHLYIIFEASKLADVLIVALNSDNSIKKYKNPKGPLIPLEQRANLMASLEYVDFVTWFDEVDPCNVLNKIKPHVHANGTEYGENCIEAATVRANGGKLTLIKRLPGLATSQIVQKIREVCD